ncbi:hypothetical protein ACVJBD_005398 [Rhizobium mongolense]
MAVFLDLRPDCRVSASPYFAVGTLKEIGAAVMTHITEIECVTARECDTAVGTYARF